MVHREMPDWSKIGPQGPSQSELLQKLAATSLPDEVRLVAQLIGPPYTPPHAADDRTLNGLLLRASPRVGNFNRLKRILAYLIAEKITISYGPIYLLNPKLEEWGGEL